MSHNALWTVFVIAVLLSRGHQARFDKQIGVDHNVKTTMKLPVYPTQETWLNDQQTGSISHAAWQEMATVNSDIVATTPSFLTTTSSADGKSAAAEGSFKSEADITSGDGISLSRTELTKSSSEVQRIMDMTSVEDLTNKNMGINQDTFNCTQIRNVQMTIPNPMEMLKRPQILLASEDTECDSDEQITAGSNRTVPSIIESIGIVQNQSNLLRKENKETEFVLTYPTKRVAGDSTDSLNIIMGLQKADDLLEDAQIGNTMTKPKKTSTHHPEDYQSVYPTTESIKTPWETGSFETIYFFLAGIHIPVCSRDSSCLGRCDHASIPDDDAENWFPVYKPNPVITENSQQDSSPLVLYNGVPFNLSRKDFSNVCPKEKVVSQCNCDRKCVIYGDCCPDVFHVCWGLFTSKAVESFIKQTHTNLLISTNHEGIIATLRQNPRDSQKILDQLYESFGSCQILDDIYYRPMMFVNRCPDVINASLKQSCEQPNYTNIAPVTAKLGSVAVAFTNRFCAECHGVLQEEYTVWATLLVCDPTLNLGKVLIIYDIDVLLKYKICNITFTDRLMACQERTCVNLKKLTSDEDQQLQFKVDSGACTQVDAFLCRSYYFNMLTYRNPHCQKCFQHGHRQRREVGLAKTTTRMITQGLQCQANSHRYEPSFQGIFLILDVSGRRLNNKQLIYSNPLLDIEPESANCTLSDVFDPISQTCKALHCPLGQIPDRGQCVASKIPKPTSNSLLQAPETTMNVSVWTYTEHISCQLFTEKLLDANLHNLVVENIHIYVFGLKNERTETIYENHNNNNNNNNNSRKQQTCAERDWTNPTHNDTLVEIKLTLTDDTDLQTWRAVEDFAEQFISDEYHVIILSNREKGQVVCASGSEPDHFKSFKIEEGNGVLQALIQVQDHELVYPLAYVAYERSFVRAGNITEDLSQSISVCEASKLFRKHGCLVISYSANDTSLNICQIHILYGEDNVDIQGNQVYVCLQQRSGVLSSSDTNIATFYIVHWTLAGVSMLCLVIMLGLYCLFPELLTLPGKMMVSLAATMLLSLVFISLTLVKMHHRYVCPLAGAVSHVLVLAQYGWMSAIAFNMALTFGPKKLNFAKSLQDKTFLKYNTLVYGVSLVLVLTSVILDILHEDPVEEEVSNACNNTTAETGNNNSITARSTLLSNHEFPRYGWPSCTWFSGPLWAQLAFVVIPFAITYVINVICYTITLYGIHTSNKQVQKLGKVSQHRVQCIIYIKLSTAMGFTSVLSFSRTLDNLSEALTCFVMSLILLQGTFLFFGFMTNRRLFSLMKKRFGNREKSLKSSTNLTARG